MEILSIKCFVYLIFTFIFVEVWESKTSYLEFVNISPRILTAEFLEISFDLQALLQLITGYHTFILLHATSKNNGICWKLCTVGMC